MECARRLRDSLFCGVSSYLVEGTLLEEGTSLAGTCWSEAFADLIGKGLRQHTRGDLCARVSQTTKGKIKGAFVV
jgi:hypothetical protein